MRTCYIPTLRSAPIWLLVAALLAVFTLVSPALQANTQAGLPVLMPETGHTLGYSFRLFHEARGGRMLFGLPISEVFIEDGLPVQYFERARFEWHANRRAVRVSDLGRRLTADRSGEAAFARAARPGSDALYVDATGHAIGGAFRAFYEGYGGATIFGLPLSEELREINQIDGKLYTVQYFERARFEFHPELPWPYTVTLGLLGREYLASHPLPPAATRLPSSAALAWEGVRPTHISMPRVGLSVAVEARGTQLDTWDVPNSRAGYFWPVSATPGTSGNIVIGGHVAAQRKIFNALPQAQLGDEVFLRVGDGQRRYLVSEIIVVNPEDIWVLSPTEHETLTLITCYPEETSAQRLIVRAVPG